MHNYYLKFPEYSSIASQLKMFRSIVRMKEIKKTLQEQRYFFLVLFVSAMNETFFFCLELYFCKHKLKKSMILKICSINFKQNDVGI
jgi:hypothetical protein